MTSIQQQQATRAKRAKRSLDMDNDGTKRHVLGDISNRVDNISTRQTTLKAKHRKNASSDQLVQKPRILTRLQLKQLQQQQQQQQQENDSENTQNMTREQQDNDSTTKHYLRQRESQQIEIEEPHHHRRREQTKNNDSSSSTDQKKDSMVIEDVQSHEIATSSSISSSLSSSSSFSSSSSSSSILTSSSSSPPSPSPSFSSSVSTSSHSLSHQDDNSSVVASAVMEDTVLQKDNKEENAPRSLSQQTAELSLSQSSSQQACSSSSSQSSTSSSSESDEKDPPAPLLSQEDQHEIFLHLKADELKYLPRVEDIRSVQKDVTFPMRSMVVDWLAQVAEEYDLSPQTLYLCINYVDRLLAVIGIHRTKLQLVALACLFIACKYEERYPPTVDDFTFLLQKQITKKELLIMETVLLTKLQFNLTVPTIYEFICRYSTYVPLTKRSRFLTEFICELFLHDPNYLRFRPSMIAASGIYLALYTQQEKAWTSELQAVCGYTFDDIRETVNAMHSCYVKIMTNPNCPLVSVREKYSTMKTMGVAHLKPPPALI
eukprot:TRINITY_DN554_c3_g1_i1.p1 TRINITY_DN554_c3_g1~~TRINITY_DN554_c3_g1_i1.p1  ORF type:complete len:545 (+),score=157.95 TRINITY_DN554_c3_g1_i1:260-1894(+)